MTRSAIVEARRLVVKVGSSSLTGADGHLDTARLRGLVDALAARCTAGSSVVLVSSGAIAAGLGPLGLASRPRDLATQQAAASVGQGALVAAYQAAFGAHGLTVGQVLLTADDVTRRTHYANARRTLDRLLDLGTVPVVNENDTVATQEIRFGDNDRLAALVAHLVHADALVLLSDVDALYDGPPTRPGSTRIAVVAGPADLDGIVVKGSGSKVGTGGMTTKIEAAGIATAAGITTVLTSADQAYAALAGDEVGTLFLPTGTRRPSRLLWLAHATTPGVGSCSTPVRSPRSSSGARPCCPRGSPRSRGASSRVTRSTSSAPTGTRGPAGWSTTPPTSCRSCSAARPRPWPASWASSTSARSSTATTSSCSDVGRHPGRWRAGRVSGPGGVVD